MGPRHYPGSHIVPQQIYNIETKYSLGIPEPTLLNVTSLRRQKDLRAWLTLTTGREWGRERGRMHKGHSRKVKNHRPLNIYQQLHNHFLSRSDHSAAHRMALPIIHLFGQQENRKAIRIVRKYIALWCQNEANPSMGWACYECQERVMSSNCQWMFSWSLQMNAFLTSEK